MDVGNASTKPKLKRKSITDRSCQLGVKKKRCQPFLGSYTTKWQCIKQSQTKNVPGYVFCTVCGCDFSVAHGGKDDVPITVSRVHLLSYMDLVVVLDQIRSFCMAHRHLT